MRRGKNTKLNKNIFNYRLISNIIIDIGVKDKVIQLKSSNFFDILLNTIKTVGLFSINSNRILWLRRKIKDKNKR